MGSTIFSYTLSTGTRLYAWNTKPIFRRPKPIFRRRKMVKASSFREKISCPSTVTEPEVGRSRPPSMCSRVDLPEPEVPTMATNSPFSTLRSTPSRAFTRVSPAP